MIPKKIHYCWLSEDTLPLNLKECINSWKEIMPEYEIVHWDKNRFNIKSIDFVNEAYAVKKWAFASDYIRLYALYTEGGIYLDVDVLVNKKFDEFLNYDFFTSVEYHPSIIEKANTKQYLYEDGRLKDNSKQIKGIGIQAAVLGSIKGHPFLKECMDYYTNKYFINNNGTFNDDILAPNIYAKIAQNYGFKYIDQSQYLRSNILILESDVFATKPNLATSNSYAIHCCAGSWKDKKGIKGLRKYLKNLMTIFYAIILKRVLVLLSRR